MYYGSRRQHVSFLIRLKYRDRTYLKILLTFNFNILRYWLGQKYFQWNLDITKAKGLAKFVPYIEVICYFEGLFHISYYDWDKENHLLYRGHRYVEVPLYPQNTRTSCLAKENQAGFYVWVTIMINILTNEFGFEIANLTVITNKRVTVIPAQKQLYIKY